MTVRISQYTWTISEQLSFQKYPFEDVSFIKTYHYNKYDHCRLAGLNLTCTVHIYRTVPTKLTAWTVSTFVPCSSKFTRLKKTKMACHTDLTMQIEIIKKYLNSSRLSYCHVCRYQVSLRPARLNCLLNHMEKIILNVTPE